MHKFAFVLEQTLGHKAHARNIQRALDQLSDEIEATVIPIDYRPLGAVQARVPGIRSWSFNASWQARTQLNRHLRQGQYEAVFIHTQVAALLARRLMRSVPTIVSLDATPNNYDAQGASYGHKRNGAVAEAVKRKINQRVFAQAAALVTWCRWASDSLISEYGVPAEKVHIIHPGVDTDLFQPHDELSPSDRQVRVLFVGGDFERKGGHDLMQAALMLGPNVHLDLVTSAPVAIPWGVSCAFHTGLLPQSPELIKLYRSADIFALPSRGDCFPQAVAEGLASGLPIVASTVGAIPEMVQEGLNGHLVPPGNPRALAAALRALVSSPSTRRVMGHRSRALAEQEHDAGANNRRIFEMMESLSPAGVELIPAAT